MNIDKNANVAGLMRQYTERADVQKAQAGRIDKIRKRMQGLDKDVPGFKQFANESAQQIAKCNVVIGESKTQCLTIARLFARALDKTAQSLAGTMQSWRDSTPLYLAVDKLAPLGVELMALHDSSAYRYIPNPIMQSARLYKPWVNKVKQDEREKIGIITAGVETLQGALDFAGTHNIPVNGRVAPTLTQGAHLLAEIESFREFAKSEQSA